jgi:hypothetical protein
MRTRQRCPVRSTPAPNQGTRSRTPGYSSVRSRHVQTYGYSAEAFMPHAQVLGDAAAGDHRPAGAVADLDGAPDRAARGEEGVPAIGRGVHPARTGPACSTPATAAVPDRTEDVPKLSPRPNRPVDPIAAPMGPARERAGHMRPELPGYSWHHVWSGVLPCGHWMTGAPFDVLPPSTLISCPLPWFTRM